MKALTLLITLVFSIFQCLAQSPSYKSNFNHIIRDKSFAIEQKLISWRRQIHQNPELGNREFETAKIVANHLKSLGIETHTGVGITGVVGILKGYKPGPVIALRADLDALPIEEKNDLPYASKATTTYNGKITGVMHACGHDTHVAILMGVAEILAGMKKDLSGTVKFIFQPAEEGVPKGESGGAELMIKEGVLENPKVEAIFGLHIDALVDVGKLSYHPGGTYASEADFKITVVGKPGHGAKPWATVDPIFVGSQIVVSLQQIVSRNLNINENGAVVTVGAFSGGNRSNVIASQIELLGTVRTFTDNQESFVFTRINQIAEKTAEAAGARAIVEIPYSSKCPVTFNDLKLTNTMLPSLYNSVGQENVLLVPAVTSSEDFGYFSQKVPALLFRLGGKDINKDVESVGQHHTAQFMINEQSLRLGVVTLCNIVFDYPVLKRNAKN